MSSTLTEQARVGHQEMEAGVNRIVKLLAHETKTHKQKLMQQHKVLKEVLTMQRSAKKVWKYYDDQDGSRKQEMEGMSGNEVLQHTEFEASLPVLLRGLGGCEFVMSKQVFNGFYSRLRELREYHKKFPNLHAEPELDPFQANLDDDPDILSQFTGEEFYGRFLDLNPHHIKFINLKGTKAVTYEAYLTIFEDFASVPEEVRTKKYRDYVKDLKDYLVSFVKRTQPLQDVDKMLEMSVEDFEEKWSAKGAPPPPAPAPLPVPGDKTPLKRTIKLEVYGEWEELVSLGLEALKNELQGLGLKCGGTLEQRAQRLFATKGAVVVGDLDQTQLAGAAAAAKAAAKAAAPAKAKAATSEPKASGGEEERRRTELRKEIGLIEHQVAELCDVLRDVIDASKAQVQKKQSRTQEELAKEMENEMGEDEPESESEEDEGEKPIYNPKKVPLDWTGKPIPYWLYKLHGLNLEYKCEICGNFSYWGPRAFERHFQEWRHAHGMRCLKIPNTRAFHNITKIKDAQDLFDRLQVEKKKIHFNAEVEEEYEDAAGNVLSKKTFHDLLRQGLL